jgi:L-ascorbate metabolism protein UlaG (beta-lactamase superfamily)
MFRPAARCAAPLAAAFILAAGPAAAQTAVDRDTDGLDVEREINPPQPRGQGEAWPTERGTALAVRPVQHASFLLGTEDADIMVDPIDGAEAWARFPAPDAILITGPGEAHYHLETLRGLDAEELHLVAPPAVAEKLPDDLAARVDALAPGDRIAVGGVMFLAPQDAPGFVLRVDGERIYVAGAATERPRSDLGGVDIAFLPLSPETLGIEGAVEAARTLSPELVYPYMYRGVDPLAFGEMLREASDGIRVSKASWYR